MGSLGQDSVHDGVVQVILPDMFLFFLAQNPRVSPHYEIIKRESEDWLLDHNGLDARSCKIIRRTDASYFCAVISPNAGAEALRTLCDFGNWVFPFDDAFDNGHLKMDAAEARKVVDGLVAILRNELDDPQSPLLAAFKSIWSRLSHMASKGVQCRFAASMTDYCEAVIQQVLLQSTASLHSSVEDLLILRRESIVTKPIFTLIEYAHGLQLPDDVIGHPVFRQIETVVTDIVLIQNDIVSYAKEKALGESHNVVSLFHLQGKDLQSSFDTAGELLRTRYRGWYLAIAELPTWGEEIDRQVQVYINDVQNVTLGNLNWSYRAERYWNGNNAEVRRTRTISIPVDPKPTYQTEV